MEENAQPKSTQIIENVKSKYPQLHDVWPSVIQFCDMCIQTFEEGHKLIITGNGGSMTDAQHIAGEMMKSFECKRPLTSDEKTAFYQYPDGLQIAEKIENGFPVLVLGLNHSLTTAILNDFSEAHLEYAQELWVLGEKGDIFLGISTSGKAKNVIAAMITAKAKGLYTVAFTGEGQNSMTNLADLSLCMPSSRTLEVQELQQIVYHTFCRMMEAHYYE